MKNNILSVAALILAVVFSSCKNQTGDPNAYIQDVRDGLALECSMPEYDPALDVELDVPIDDLWTYKGTLGEDLVSFFFTISNVADGSICGYMYYDEGKGDFIPREPSATFKIASNEPDPNGFNKVVFDLISPSGENIGKLKGTVEGRGDGFSGTFIPQNGESVPFETMRSY